MDLVSSTGSTTSPYFTEKARMYSSVSLIEMELVVNCQRESHPIICASERYQNWAGFRANSLVAQLDLDHYYKIRDRLKKQMGEK